MRGNGLTVVDRSVSRAHRRRKILVVAPRDPYPTIGGDRLRISRLARELARHYDLTLVTLCASKREYLAPLPTDGVFKRIHRVLLPTWRSWLNTLAAIPSAEPLQVAYYRSAAFARAVRRLAPGHDAVLAHLIRTADYVRDLPMVRILEMTDAISMSMRRVAATKADYFDIRRIVYRLEATRLRSRERRVVDGFDLVTITSRADKTYLFGAEGIAEPPIMVIPNGVDAPAELPPPQTARNPDEIAFLGHIGSLQNFDAVWFFARHVLPLIRRQRPSAVFRIIGPIRRGAARALGALPGVVVEGLVDDVSAALATARVGVCPNRMNAGIQNKVLDYLANRLAVVCSSESLEGVEAVPDEHLLRADTPQQWADQVLRLLDDAQLAQRLADEGRTLVIDRYRWEQRAQPLIGRLENLFEQRARAAQAALARPAADPVLADEPV
jgi:glycosyltransferase involved in cell wall biosynthesis